MTTPRFHRLAVNDLRRETADAVSMTFAIPRELAGDYSFLPGQYLTLRTSMDGEEVRRSYSICSGPDDGELRIAVKKVDGGAFSSWAADELKSGDELDVMTPTGRFGVAHAPDQARLHVGFAAGSGITPVLSIARTVLAREPRSEILLVYGNRNSRSIMFAETIEDMKNRHIGRLSVLHVLSREQQEVALANGRIDADKVRAIGRSLIDPAAIDGAFICGPEAMTVAVRAALTEIGVPADRIQVELFTTSQARARRTAPRRAMPAEAGAVVATVEAIVDGQRHTFPFTSGDGGVVDAAERAGIELPYSCRGGMCCTCRAKIVEGKARMETNYSLEPWEIEAGFTLACQSRPTTDRLVLDFDQT